MVVGFRNLTVYEKAFAFAMDIYHVSKKFPKNELCIFVFSDKKILNICFFKYW
jgi:hypothetical protein